MITCTKNAITPSYCNHFSTHFYTPIMHSPSFIMFLHYKSHPQQFSPMPTNAHSPCKFSPIFMDFSNAQLLLKHTTDCCTENAKTRGKCDNCHSATTHHLSAMKITDCMLSIHCKLIFLSLSTLHHYKIHCF